MLSPFLFLQWKNISDNKQSNKLKWLKANSKSQDAKSGYQLDMTKIGKRTLLLSHQRTMWITNFGTMEETRLLMNTKNINNFHLWDNEEEGEVIDNKPSLKVYITSELLETVQETFG